MARGSSGKGSGAARVRFVILEAEVPDGDLGQVTQVLQNALRPDGASSIKRLIAVAPPSPAAANDSGQEVDELEEVEEVTQSETASPRGARKGKTPTVLTDVDLTSAPSFTEFAQQKNPTSDRKKFLVVAAWFKLHRGEETVTVHHVYTCYRAVKWPTGIPDFAQPLRNLKSDQLVDGKGKGTYAINHLGLAEIDG